MSSLRILLLAASLAGWFGALPARAETMRICIDAQPHPPMLMPDASGHVGDLMRRAARDAGVAIEFRAMPVMRCRAEIAAGRMDAFPMTPFVSELQAIAVYPMREGRPDPTFATHRTQWMAFRKVGGTARWDGQRFSDLHMPVLVSFGSLALIEHLRASNVRYDDNGRSLEVNFAKLMAGRGSLAIGLEEEGGLLMLRPEFSGKVERLALPVGQTLYYLAVSKRYHARNEGKVERFWRAIGSARGTHQPSPRPPKRS